MAVVSQECMYEGCGGLVLCDMYETFHKAIWLKSFRFRSQILEGSMTEFDREREMRIIDRVKTWTLREHSLFDAFREGVREGEWKMLDEMLCLAG